MRKLFGGKKQGGDENKSLGIEVWGVEDNVKIYKTLANAIEYDSSFDIKNIKKKTIADVEGAFVLDNVLTKEECKSFIALSEKFGYNDNTVSIHGHYYLMKNVRNNKRVMWQCDATIWEPVYNRIMSLLPPVIMIEEPQYHYLTGEEQTKEKETWEICNLNERLRFYRYESDEEFKKHYDTFYRRDFNEKSFMTLIFYLNDGFRGGCTTFFVNDDKPVPVDPKAGSALLFFHGTHPLSPLHEGSVVKKGQKYVMRSDVMYRKKIISKEQPKEQPKEQSKD